MFSKDKMGIDGQLMKVILWPCSFNTEQLILVFYRVKKKTNTVITVKRKRNPMQMFVH